MLPFDEIGSGFRIFCSISFFHKIGLFLTFQFSTNKIQLINRGWPATDLQILRFVPQLFSDQLIILYVIGVDQISLGRLGVPSILSCLGCRV